MCRSEGRGAGPHLQWIAETGEEKWPEPPAPLEAVYAEAAGDQMRTETQGCTESSGSPLVVFGNLLLGSERALSLLGLAGLLSPQSLQWHCLWLTQLGWR